MTAHLEWMWVFNLKTVLKLVLLSPQGLPNAVLASTQDTQLYSRSKTLFNRAQGGFRCIFLTTRHVASYCMILKRHDICSMTHWHKIHFNLVLASLTVCSLTI